MGTNQLPRGVRRIGPSRNHPKGGYEASYRTPDGKERTKRTTRLVDATGWLDAQRGDKVRGVHVDPAAGRQPFISFADEWALAQDWKGTTRDAWTFVRGRLDPILGSLPMSSIDHLTLQRARQMLRAKYERSTTDLTMSYATMILRAAHRAGRLPRDPTLGYRTPKVRADEDDGKVGPDDVPTRAEVLAILDATPPPYRAAVALGIAGLRVGEVLGLTGNRVLVDQRKVTIDRQLQRVDGDLRFTTPKSEKVRTIVVPGVVAVELRRHLRDHAGPDQDLPLFSGRRGTPMMRRDQFYASAWRPALLGAGLSSDRFVFHSLRHFCASNLLAEGAPMTAVAGYLGDTVQTVASTYVHWLRDDQEVPADVLDGVLAPPAVGTSAREPAPVVISPS